MKKLGSGKLNLAAGFFVIALFMAYGFFLIYLRDFAPGKEEWIAAYSSGKHFETRLAHVHGALFSVLNMILGIALIHMQAAKQNLLKAVEGFGLLGLLMPLGILAEVYFGAPPFLVLLGGISILISFVLAGVAALQSNQ